MEDHVVDSVVAMNDAAHRRPDVWNGTAEPSGQVVEGGDFPRLGQSPLPSPSVHLPSQVTRRPPECGQARRRGVNLVQPSK